MSRSNRILKSLATVVAAAIGIHAGTAMAEPRSKSTQTEAVWVKFDPETNTVTARIRKPGKGAKPPAHLALRKGREADFRVLPTGSVLQRTSVAVNGRRGDITDIPAGKTVNIYWVPDPEDEKQRFARKIDVIISEEEWEEKFEAEE